MKLREAPISSRSWKKLEEVGCLLLRHGGRHDIYHNPRTGKSQPVPSHREVNEFLARKIIKDLMKSNDPA